MRGIVDRCGWKAMILVSTLVAGCESTASVSLGKARVLNGFELDRVTVGSAMAVNNGEALALGSAPQTAASTGTVANSSGGLTGGVPLLNSANSNVAASAAGGVLVQASGASQIEVNGGSGGAAISAAANSSTASANENNNNASVTMQFTGLSLSHVDLAYGSVTAAACCNATNQANAAIETAAGGPYIEELEADPLSDTPAETQRRIDVTVVSATLPLLDAGRAAAIAPTLAQISNQ